VTTGAILKYHFTFSSEESSYIRVNTVAYGGGHGTQTKRNKTVTC
jgi:hypothetical protein